MSVWLIAGLVYWAGCFVLLLDVVQEFIRYEGRLFSQLLFERGELDEPPPEPHVPPHRATIAEAIDNELFAADAPAAGAEANSELVLH